MNLNYKFAWAAFGGIIGLVLLVIVLLWVWVLFAKDPSTHPVAKAAPWPIACSTRGCMTTQNWIETHGRMQSFAQATGQEDPRWEDSLTTTLRGHLVRHAFLKSPVTPSDARRYREEVLRIKDEALVETTSGVSLQDYDALVLLPLLQQEALRQQDSVESVDELYKKLSRERFIVFLLFRYAWDREEGKALARE